MAAAMARRLAELNRAWLESGWLTQPIVCRIGIHGGEATVGSSGSAARGDYTTIGRAVNLARRLEGAATPGRILVSAGTWALLGGRFAGTPGGAIAVKGFAEPIDVVESIWRPCWITLPRVLDWVKLVADESSFVRPIPGPAEGRRGGLSAGFVFDDSH